MALSYTVQDCRLIYQPHSDGGQNAKTFVHWGFFCSPWQSKPWQSKLIWNSPLWQPCSVCVALGCKTLSVITMPAIFIWCGLRLLFLLIYWPHNEQCVIKVHIGTKTDKLVLFLISSDNHQMGQSLYLQLNHAIWHGCNKVNIEFFLLFSACNKCSQRPIFRTP